MQPSAAATERKTIGRFIARESYAVQTKGHRVIAMPPCSTGLAPPAFTAPCRNQTSERTQHFAKAVPDRFVGKCAGSGVSTPRKTRRLCQRSYGSDLHR